MNRIDESYVEGQQKRGRITEEEKGMILSTPQI